MSIYTSVHCAFRELYCNDVTIKYRSILEIMYHHFKSPDGKKFELFESSDVSPEAFKLASELSDSQMFSIAERIVNGAYNRRTFTAVESLLITGFQDEWNRRKVLLFTDNPSADQQDAYYWYQHYTDIGVGPYFMHVKTDSAANTPTKIKPSPCGQSAADVERKFFSLILKFITTDATPETLFPQENDDKVEHPLPLALRSPAKRTSKRRRQQDSCV